VAVGEGGVAVVEREDLEGVVCVDGVDEVVEVVD